MTGMMGSDEASRIDDALFRLSWPLARLGEAVEALARRSGLIRAASQATLELPRSVESIGEISDWLDWATAQLGLEAVEVATPAPSLDAMLLGGGPAILFHRSGGAFGFLALVGRKGARPLFLAPDLGLRAHDLAPVRALLCRPLEAPLRPEVERLLDLAGVAPARRAEVAAALLRERLADQRIGNAFLLRLPASAPLARQMKQARSWRLLGGVLGIFALSYLLEIGGWGLIGSAALGGRFDSGWLAAWAMLLFTLLGIRIVGGWLESEFALNVSRLLKSRLLAGALAMRPDAVKRSGVGHLIGRVIESQALESLSLNGGLSVVVAALELALAGWVLGKGAAPSIHLLLLVLFAVTTGGLGWRFYRRLRRWSRARLDMTNDLIESMVGHRTRLAQDRAERREAQEDAMMQAYLGQSADMDKAALVGISSLPSMWMFAGIACLLPAFAGQAMPTPAALAISVGGLFLGQRALGGIAGGLAGLGRALVAWEQVRPIYKASRTAPSNGPYLSATGAAGAPQRLIDAEGIVFRYPGAAAPVVEGASLTIGRGDRILLEGPSGGGKSTLAALLTGLELPESGLLLLDGLDRPSLGDGWHRLATSAPQFHENHILSGTLGFNLLMGRRWPASDADLAEAQALCEELGLGDLLRRMPGGINQRVGETGWQLSHGERSRIFLARALLQDAELTVMDESFASLDPEALERCLACAIARARSLVVIAHP
jgi:ATP-binding cassette subfamily B protein